MLCKKIDSMTHVKLTCTPRSVQEQQANMDMGRMQLVIDDPAVHGVLILTSDCAPRGSRKRKSMAQERSSEEYSLTLYIDVGRLPRKVAEALCTEEPFTEFEDDVSEFYRYTVTCEDSDEESSGDDMDGKDAEKEPMIIDFTGGYKPDTDGTLGDPDTWPDYVATLEPVGDYTDRGVGLRTVLDENVPDNTVLVCSVAIHDGCVKPHELLWSAECAVKRAVWGR